MVPTWAMLLSPVFLFILLDVSVAEVSRVFKCPCSFSVARQRDLAGARNSESFDVLAENFVSPRSKFEEMSRKIIERHSSRNLWVGNTSQSDSAFTYFPRQEIRDKGFFRVRIHHHRLNAEVADPVYRLQLHESAKQVICPVVLEPDLPKEKRFRKTKKADQTNLNEVSRQHRIEGGLFAASTLRRYMVSIAIPCDSGEPKCYVSCSGTLISPQWVMTAAHCQIPRGARVHLSPRTRLTGPFVEVSRTIRHPNFDRGLRPERQNQFDIQVLELNESVRGLKTRFMPISLNENPQSGAFARAAGYGRISDDFDARDHPNDGRLHQVDLPIVRSRLCNNEYSRTTLDIISRARQVCAGYFEAGGCDTCFGDSGGPLVQYGRNRPVLIGVTSFGLGCGMPSYPGVYTRPSGVRKWLEATGADFKVYGGTLDQVVRKCQRGEFLPYTRGRVSECTRCDAGSVSRGGPVRVCKKCDRNLRPDPVNAARCTCRGRKGWGLRLGPRRCERCPKGSFSPVGKNRCSLCRRGTFSNKTGRARCRRCPGALRGATKCDSA